MATSPTKCLTPGHNQFRSQILREFKSPQQLNQRQSRWHYELAQYKFFIEYKRGQLNVIADLLSRDPAHLYDPKELDVYNNVTLLPGTLFNIESSQSPLFNRVIKAQGLDQFSLGKLAEIKSASSANKVGDFTATEKTLFYKGLLWVPEGTLRTKVIEQCHDHILAGHPGISGTILLIKHNFIWMGLRSQ